VHNDDDDDDDEGENPKEKKSIYILTPPHLHAPTCSISNLTTTHIEKQRSSVFSVGLCTRGCAVTMPIHFPIIWDVVKL